VLIVNADDLGMYHAINAAVIDSIENGIASSCSLMVPCPWAVQAMQLLRQRPQIPFGIHLTLVCDTTLHRWGPLTAKEKVPSLLDGVGALFTPDKAPELLVQARFDEVELEFRAQIDTVAVCRSASTNGRCTPAWATRSRRPSTAVGACGGPTTSSSPRRRPANSSDRRESS